MFAITLPRLALAALSLTIAVGTAQAQTPKVGEPAPSASKTKVGDARFTPKTKAKAEITRPDARRGKALRKTPRGQRVNANGGKRRVTRPAAAPNAGKLRAAPRGQRVNVAGKRRVTRPAAAPKGGKLRAAPRGQRVNAVPGRKSHATSVGKTPNLRVKPKRTSPARRPVAKPARKPNLRGCHPGDPRLECRQEIIRSR